MWPDLYFLTIVHSDWRHACNAARTQTVANGQRDIILSADVKDVIPVPVAHSPDFSKRMSQHHVPAA